MSIGCLNGRFWFLLCLLFFVAGCQSELAAPPQSSAILPTAIPTEKFGQEDVYAPTVTAVNKETLADDTAVACADIFLQFGEPTTGKVHWRLDSSGSVHCCDYSSALYQISRNPDPDTELALFSVITDSNVPISSANVLVDMNSGAYKVLGLDFQGLPKYVWDWLPDGEVVWLDDQGELYIGTLETQKAVDTPARMTNLWYAAPDRILFRDEARQFWYLNLNDLTWTLLPQSESEKITWEWVDYAGVSDDGDYLFFFFHDSVATLSNESGVINVVEREEPYPIASGGPDEDPLWRPPEQIKGTPYWLLNSIWLIRDFEGISYPTYRFIVDSRTGEVVAHDILGIPDSLAVYHTFLSPDREWIAVETVSAIETLETYPAEVSQTWFISLSTGNVRIEEGEFAGWETGNEAYPTSSQPCAEREIVIDWAASTKD
ncbi:MAG TPA: hypothetical protein ENK32_01895 [Anaerolineae bacterium]|nr:hypothetical protein [Anaerolineae bacterium]